MTAAPHLHLVDTTTGELSPVCLACVEKDKRLAALSRKVTLLENAEQERLGLAPDASTILDILQHHKRLFPGTRIIRGKTAWKNVKGRLVDVDADTEKPAFAPLYLKAAAVGLKLGRTGTKADRPHGAAWLYEDADRVQYWIGQCVTFKRDIGTSALTIVDELGRPGLERLAARCECGHLRLDHERENPAEELWDPPCAVHGCACTGWYEDKVARWIAERARMSA